MLYLWYIIMAKKIYLFHRFLRFWRYIRDFRDIFHERYIFHHNFQRKDIYFRDISQKRYISHKGTIQLHNFWWYIFVVQKIYLFLEKLYLQCCAHHTISSATDVFSNSPLKITLLRRSRASDTWMKTVPLQNICMRPAFHHILSLSRSTRNDIAEVLGKWKPKVLLL